MNVVERTNPSGRMGKLEETEAGEEVKGGKREGEQNPRGAGKEGAWLLTGTGAVAPVLNGPSGCKANTTQKQATTTVDRGGEKGAVTLLPYSIPYQVRQRLNC
jgi:hypothetical protein